jgi:hypothetical protein
MPNRIPSSKEPKEAGPLIRGEHSFERDPVEFRGISVFGNDLSDGIIGLCGIRRNRRPKFGHLNRFARDFEQRDRLKNNGNVQLLLFLGIGPPRSREDPESSKQRLGTSRRALLITWRRKGH